MKNQFDIEEIPNSGLTLDNVPPPNAPFYDVIDKFALSYDGYTHRGERCGDIADKALERYEKTSKLPKSLNDLRTCLFFEQRRWRHFAEDPDEHAMRYIYALVNAIRAVVEP